MTDRPEPRAGGALVALALLAGATIGVVCGQPTIGVLAGAAAGAGAAGWLWWRDQDRGRS